MDNFLDRLNRNPYQPIDSASITRVDELGNGYDDWNNLIAPKFEAPQQTWGETALSVATAPARIAAALAGSLSPYGADGWQVPPIVHEGVNALTAVGDAYNYGMTDDEINSRALGMAGFMMGGGGPAAALERSLAQRGINSTADMIPTAVKDYGQAAYRSLRYPNETAVLDSLPPGLLDRTGPQVMPSYGFGNTSGKMAPSSAEYIADSVRGDVPNNPYTVNDGWALARSETGYMNALLQSRKPEFDVIDGGLFSNASKEGAVPGIVSATQTGIGLPAFEMRAPGGKSIGRAQYDELPNAVRVKDVEIDPAFRRQGMASRLYGEIQDRTGKPMTPDTMLTPDGKAFWESSYPKAVSDYEFDGQYWRQPYTPDESVPDWRMSGGPNRPEGALWSNASKESSIPAIASALGQEQSIPDWLLPFLPPQ